MHVTLGRPWAMAIGDSSSGQGHEEWGAAQYYQRSTTPSAGSGGGLVFARDNPVTESTVVTTTATTSAASSAPGGGGAQPVSEGRVGKARRRSRASRKAPTTVLNTDTANFRAMVQQFTGVPAAPPFHGGGYQQVVADVGAGGGPATLSFGLHGGGAGQQLYQRQAGFPFGPPPPQFQQHHERPVLFTLGGAGGATTSGAYLRPGRGGGNPERAGMDASTDGLLLESIPPSQMMSRPAASSSGSSTTNRFLL